MFHRISIIRKRQAQFMRLLIMSQVFVILLQSTLTEMDVRLEIVKERVFQFLFQQELAHGK